MSNSKKSCAILVASFLLLSGIFLGESLIENSFALPITNNNTVVPPPSTTPSSPVTDDNPSEVIVNVSGNGIAMQVLDATATNAIDHLNLDLSPSPTGVFNKTTAIIEVGTTNPTGYTLTMISDYQDHSSTYTNDLVYTTSGVNDVISSIIPASGDSITESQFSVANSSYMNNWGYSLNSATVTVTEVGGVSTVTVTNNADPSTITYKAVPAHGGTAATLRDDVTTATGASYTPITIGTNVNTAIRSGTYSNRLLFTATANPQNVTYTLNYDGNGGANTVTNLPTTDTKTVMAQQGSFTISSTVPVNSGSLTFKGWSTSSDSDAGSGSGTNGLYVGGDTFTIIADDSDPTSTTKTLYARWQ